MKWPTFPPRLNWYKTDAPFFETCIELFRAAVVNGIIYFDRTLNKYWSVSINISNCDVTMTTNVLHCLPLFIFSQTPWMIASQSQTELSVQGNINGWTNLIAPLVLWKFEGPFLYILGTRPRQNVLETSSWYTSVQIASTVKCSQYPFVQIWNRYTSRSAQYDLLCIHCATCDIILTCTLRADSGLSAKPRPVRTCSRFHIV